MVGHSPSPGNGGRKCHHSRLLRRVLLLSSLLTLGGLHVSDRTSPCSWRVARLVPLTFCLAGLLFNAAFVVTSDSSQTALSSMAYGIVAFHALLVLLQLLRRRRQLHDILRKAAALEKATAFCRLRGDFTSFQWKVGILTALTTIAYPMWITSLLTDGELKPPNYLFPVLLPKAVQGPAWYWTIVGLQLAAAMMSFTLQGVFDLLMIGLADTVTVAQIRLARYAKRLFENGDRRSAKGPFKDGQEAVWIEDESVTDISNDKPGGQGVVARGAHLSALIQAYRVGVQDGHRPPTDTNNGTKSLGKRGPVTTSGDAPDDLENETNEYASDELSAFHRCPTLTKPSGDLDEGLHQLADAYRAVHALSTESAELCSLLTLAQHASVTLILLVGVYVTIAQRSTFSGIRFSSFVVFLLMSALRLAAVSSAGSRLITSGEQLSTTLVGASWRGVPPTQLQFGFQMLVEQTRKPLAFDGYGIFVPQKQTMLSLMSFILTYFVIMVQLGF